MRKLMIGLALVGSAVAAMPAAAQQWDGGDRGGRGWHDDRDRGWGHRSESLRRASWMLDRMIQRGILSRGEVRRYRSELRDIHELEADYRRDGYSRRERERVDERADRLIYRLRREWREERRDRWDDDRRDRWDD